MYKYITKIPYKSFWLFLCIILFSCFSVSVMAEDDTNTIKSMSDYQYIVNEEDNTIEIVRYTGESQNISIPETIENLEVTSIGTGAFTNLSKLSTVSIPDTVQFIGNSAFSECSSLTQVSFPKNLKLIGDSAFSGCLALKSVNLPDTVTTIGNYAFANCKSIESITFSQNLVSVGDYAFLGCVLLNDIQLSNPNAELGAYALEGTAWLSTQNNDVWVTLNDIILIKYNGTDTELVIPKNIQTIAAAAFADNESITSVDFSKSSVGFIGDRAFENCSNLKKVIFNEKVSVIKERVFHNCSALKDITLPSTLTELGGEAFEGCSSLTHIEIPKGVQVLDTGLFKDCTALTSVKLNEGLKYIYSLAFENCTSLGIIEFPKTLQEIYSIAFSDCISLTRIVFEESQSNIYPSAFSCENIQEIVFKGGTPQIDENAFSAKTAIVYCDTSNKNSTPMTFAKSAGFEVVSLGELPAYSNQGVFEEKETEEGFYSSYIWITIIMIVVDIAIVLLFGIYIMFFSRKKSKKSANKMTKV